MSIRDVFQDCLALSAVQAEIFEFIALCQFGAAEDAPSNRDEREAILEKVAGFEQMLRRGLADSFQRASTEVPSALEDARVAADAAMGPIAGALRRVNEEDSPTEAALRDLFQRHKSQVVPAITRFITVFETELADIEARSDQTRRAVIDTAVSEIDDINSVINLISVNASVEAARAGEAGRGFAVIANEIQTLSQRSKQAVLDIRNRLR